MYVEVINNITLSYEMVKSFLLAKSTGTDLTDGHYFIRFFSVLIELYRNLHKEGFSLFGLV